jgi:hypothetical protein
MTIASPFETLPGGWLAARRTLVLTGNLPVMNGLWLSQYADREAREHGPVCLVRLSDDSVQIELFRAGTRRPAIRPQARHDEAIRAIAPVVSQWLIVPRQSEPVEIPQGTDDIVVLTGADQPAIIAAYRLVKGAHEQAARLGGNRPAVSVAVLGADANETAHVAARIGEAAGAALSTTVPVRGGLQRVAPAESSFRGTFDVASPTLESVCALIAGAASTEQRQSAAPESSEAPLRFAPRSERRPPAQRSGADAIPFRAELPPRGVRGSEPVRTPPSHAPRSSLSPSDAESLNRAILADASATLREAAPSGTVGTRGAYVASAVNGPSAAPPIARIVEGGMPESLVPFVPGLERIDHTAPRCERIEFAVGDGGRLHLVCRVDDLRMLARARNWLGENAGLFRRAFPEVASTEDPAIDVFVRDMKDIEPIEGATIRVIRELEFGGRRCFDVQTLSA